MKSTHKPAGVFTPWVYDTRVQARYLADAVISNDQLAAHLKTLPDVADKGEPVHTLSPGASEIDDEDDDDLDEEG
jgi:hypothetical protein